MDANDYYLQFSWAGRAESREVCQRRLLSFFLALRGLYPDLEFIHYPGVGSAKQFRPTPAHVKRILDASVIAEDVSDSAIPGAGYACVIGIRAKSFMRTFSISCGSSLAHLENVISLSLPGDGVQLYPLPLDELLRLCVIIIESWSPDRGLLGHYSLPSYNPAVNNIEVGIITFFNYKISLKLMPKKSLIRVLDVSEGMIAYIDPDASSQVTIASIPPILQDLGVNVRRAD